MKIVNKRARYEYELFEKFEAGIALIGPEVKSIREGKISLDDSFARVRDGEVWLFNCHIHPYRFADIKDQDPTRPRKILLHKKEITSLESKMKQKRLTMVPLACYTRGRRIKLELALGRGKREFEKRGAKKKRDIELELERELAGSE